MNGPCCIAVRPFLMGYVLSRLSSVCRRFGTAANGESNAVTRPEIELKHTNYDRADASRRIAATGFPNATDFDMLKSPSSEKMLELYSKAELKS
jgi:hypothetical protein